MAKQRTRRWVQLRGQRTLVYQWNRREANDWKDDTAILFSHGRDDGGPVLFVRSWRELADVMIALDTRQ